MDFSSSSSTEFTNLQLKKLLSAITFYRTKYNQQYLYLWRWRRGLPSNCLDTTMTEIFAPQPSERSSTSYGKEKENLNFLSQIE
jgi:hypothetical protein